jgi:alcohol dehydrogenase class IV
MTDSKKSWYQTNTDMVLKTTREAFRGFIANFWVPKLMVGKASITFLARYLIGQFPKESDRKTLIMVDKNLEKHANRIAASLGRRGFECQIWNGVEPEVPLYAVKTALKVCNSFKPQILIAIGGGSAIDTAKMVFLMYEKPDLDFYSMLPFDSLGLRMKIKQFIAIPTTSGTGSEATYGSMIKDTSQNPPRKIHVTNLELLPDIAIHSFEFVKDMPAPLTAGTGVDALVHAISSMLCSCHNTLGDTVCLEAIRLILKFLPRAYRHSNDLEARTQMQYAAYLAGLAVTNIGISLDHSLGHALGDLFEVHHGVAVGIFCSYAIQFIAKNSDRYIEIAKKFDVKVQGRKNEEILDDLINKYKDLLRSLDLPTSISELQMPAISKLDYMNELSGLEYMAWSDICNFVSLRVPNKDDLKKIFIYAYDGKNIDF